jgi:hypothetical protein
MLDELLPCANCSGQPDFAFDNDIKMVRLFCKTCLISTSKIPYGADRNVALAQLVQTWNTRPNRTPTEEGSILDLINKEVNAVDTPLVLELIARNEQDWESRGPLLAALAAKCIDSSLAYSEWWPVETLIKDAARYRKLLQRVRFETVGSKRLLQFTPIETAEPEDHCSHDALVGLTIDELPDRNRW